MPQMTSPFLGPLTGTSNIGYNILPTASIAGNVILGGQLGFGNNLPNIDAATPLVLRPIVPIITHVPTMFTNYAPNLALILKGLVETQTRSIDGIDLQYTIDPGTTPAGQDGQELNVPTNAKRAQVNPQFVLPELGGNLVWNFFRTWMRMIKDPDTQASSLAGLIGGSILTPHVLSMYTMDMLFIQYDTTLQPQNIIDGYFITSMWPNDIGTAGFKKQIGQSEVVERTIAFHGVLQHNDNTRSVAQNIAQLLQLHTIDYNYATPIATSIENVNALTDATSGLLSSVETDISSFGSIALTGG